MQALTARSKQSAIPSVRKMRKNKAEHPSKDAFLTNPVASASEFTGYGVKMPLNEFEAESLSDMFEKVPTTPSRLKNKRDK